MKKTAALLLLPLLAPAWTAAADADYHYYRISNRANWEHQVVTRQDFVVNDDVPSRYEFCMVNPGADWAIESKDPKIEEKYLDLLDRVILSDGIMGGDGDGVGGTFGGSCGAVKRFGQTGDFQRMDQVFLKNCVSDDRVPQAHKYACLNRRIATPGFTVVDTLKTLLRSDHPATVKHALQEARMMKRAETLFGPTVAQLVLDARQPMDVRLAAAETLSTIVPTELTGKTLASLWLDGKLKDEERIALMNDFSFVLRWGDQHGNVSVPLKPYLRALHSLHNQHIDETTGKADPLGAAALCAMKSYPQKMQDEEKIIQ